MWSFQGLPIDHIWLVQICALNTKFSHKWHIWRAKKGQVGYPLVNLGWAIECCAMCIMFKECQTEILLWNLLWDLFLWWGSHLHLYDPFLLKLNRLGFPHSNPKIQDWVFPLMHILCENQHSEPHTTISFGASHWASSRVGHVGHTGQWHLTSYSAAGPLWNLPAICARFSKSVRYPHVSHSHWY